MSKENHTSEFLNGLQIKVLQDLFNIGVIKFGQFRFKHHENNPEAPLEPVYVNLRLIRAYPELLRLTANLYENLLSGLKYELLAEIPNAATPIATAISLDLGIGTRGVRMSKKDHGLDNRIDGFLSTDEGKRAVLIDDLITKATSKLDAIDVLWEEGIDVRDCVVLIDREQGGRAELAQKGIELHSAFTLRQMVDYYLKTGRMSKEEHAEVGKLYK